MTPYKFQRKGRVIIVLWTNKTEAREVAEMVFKKDER